MVAKIAVSAAVYQIDKPYDYAIPPSLTVLPGMRVLVPFGRANKMTEGVVLSVAEGDESGCKQIVQCLDEAPVLDGQMLKLAAFVRKRYYCTFYDAIKAMLPSGLWFQVKETYSLADDVGDWKETIKRKKTAIPIMEYLEASGGTIQGQELRRQFPNETELQDALSYLFSKKLIVSQSNLMRKASDRMEQLASLAVSNEEAAEYAARKKKKSPLQAAVLELLIVVGSCSTKELCYFTGASIAVIRRLAALELVKLDAREVLRAPIELPEVQTEPAVLNEEQQLAYEGLVRQRHQEPSGVALLYGVTGSGKTAVYLQLIDDCLKEGKSALLLVPEIALTPQLMQLLSGRFGKLVAVLHSGLRVGQRYDEWKRIRRGDARVVVGTRSAVFAPLQNPGILILDEEQEHTYKSENTPRYHAREVAIFRGDQSHCMVLLGSATPSVESMYRALDGRYSLYRLRSRYNRSALPQAEIVDMKQELRAGNGSAISRLLRQRLQTLGSEQAILFLNRRGNSRYLICVDCGYVPKCQRCSVNLTYHSANHRLMCHYCGYSEQVTGRCPQCGGHLKTVGFGTQRVQEELYDQIPDISILRMDADTVSAVNSHEVILDRFRTENCRVLLGTQMITKGLDFENVTLVGVLDADAALYVDHYRAAETAFSMIAQVIGRSGRGAQKGSAIIQTMTPENQVIKLAAQQDYDSFYQMELPTRQLRGCPPFADLTTVTFFGMMEPRVRMGAERFREMLMAVLQTQNLNEVHVLGPAPASVAKINNTYRYRLTISSRTAAQMQGPIAYLLRTFAKEPHSKGVSVFADINTYD